MASRAPALFAALVALSAAACSSASGPGHLTTGTSGSGGSDGGDGGADSGMTGGALPYYGHVFFQTVSAYDRFGTYYTHNDVTDVFFDGGTPFEFANCVAAGGTSIPPCCFFPGQRDAGFALVTTLSAGNINLLDDGGDSAVLRYHGSGGYGMPAFGWDAGDQIFVSAAGGQVEAFSGEVQVLPEIDFPDGAPPASQQGGGPPIVLGQDFVLYWFPATGYPATTSMNLTLVDLSQNSGTPASLLCTAPDSAGSLTVPAAALAGFASGDLSMLTMERSNPSSQVNSNARITLDAPSLYSGERKFK